jgi:hypothetical protein
MKFTFMMFFLRSIGDRVCTQDVATKEMGRYTQTSLLKFVFFQINQVD